MNNTVERNVDYLGPPRWEDTRPIYQKLSEEFHVLTDAYHLEIDDRTKIMLDHLILSIDEVDKAIDCLPEKSERDGLTSSMLDFLDGDQKHWSHSLANAQLTGSIELLKRIVEEQGVKDRFIAAVAEIFDFTERKRHVFEDDELIDWVCREGRSTSELPLAIMKVDKSQPFAKMFRHLCTLMGVADLLIDARRDYRAGYIVIKPEVGLYLKLAKLLVVQGLRLTWSFPGRLGFVVYCLKCMCLLVKAE